MTRAATFTATVVWSPGIERDGDHWPVSITFEAGGFQPYVEATREQPAEGGCFEDTFFKIAEIEDGEPKELTSAELVAANAWFDSSAASDAIQESAREQAPSSDPDPDRARDEAWERMMMDSASVDDGGEF